MLIETITSRSNPLVKRFIAAREGRDRQTMFIEGIRLVEEAVSSAIKLEALAYSPRLPETARGAALLSELQHLPCRAARLTEDLMTYISDVETAPGIIALGRRPVVALPDVGSHHPALFVLADGLQSPGNLGALIRTAEATAATGLLATLGTADPFQPKALRAAAGSAFRLPIVTGESAAVWCQQLRRQGIRIVAADQRGDTPYDAFDWQPPTAIWLGSEGHGLASANGNAQTQCDARLTIPMHGRVESLNVAVAGALLLYEARRQRMQGQSGRAQDAP
ncbi:MAG: RNA methyltransferase [Chloracidobacterium sp.]|uniref:RNA methyltransferase n=1 Tax=Chloracidobacterium validum TaxID=2821543 RepID=A0ABX8B8P7_9BACT|nr:RNA methyltransferase [Chloracidobacterium validum]QUW02822.1 RNA methyltransferase [Chloracidobacterium validum]